MLDREVPAALIPPALVLFILFGSADAEPAKPPVPSFDRYKVQDVYKGKGHKPDLDPAEPIDGPKNTVLRGKLELPAEFAGQYWVAEYACGTDCTGFAVVDMATGWRMFESSITYAYKTARRGTLPAGLVYRQKSRLLVVNGCPEGRACGSYYYEMTETGGIDLLTVSEFNPQP